MNIRQTRSTGVRTVLAPLAFGLVLAAGFGCKEKAITVADVKDVVQITVDEDGFKPAHIAAKKGRPLTLVFNRTSDKTCATAVVIPSQSINKDIPMNAATPVSFIPDKAGETPFSCPMNMVKGNITVFN